MNSIKFLQISKNSVMRVIVTLFVICFFWEFVIMLILEKFSTGNLLLDAAIDTTLLSLLSSTTFWLVYFKSNWRSQEEEVKNINQQINALNQVAIISSTDRSGKITFANQNFCNISGYTADELIGKNHRIVKSEYHNKEFYKTMWDKITNGQIWQGQVQNKKKNGEHYWVFSSIIPLKNKETKQVEEFLSIRFDITNEKKLEEQLESEQSKSIHMARLAAIGEMAGSVAHEVNNPIAVVLGKIHLLKRTIEQVTDADIKQNILKNLISIEDQSKRVSKIVKGLREFSHSGEVEKLEDVNSIQIIDSVLELCGEKLKFNNVEIRKNIDSTNFYSSKLQLEQVLVNLINNGIDAISELESKWIDLSIFEKDNYIYFSIIDSGAGIPAPLLEKIMQPFFTTKPVGKGTGLGLSISKGIIEKLGGEFKYDSTSKNTRFTIVIPKSEAVIFKSITYADTFENINLLKSKLSGEFDESSVEEINVDFILKEANSSLSIWINRYQFCLSKNPDFIEFKEDYQEYIKTITEIQNRIHTRSIIDFEIRDGLIKRISNVKHNLEVKLNNFKSKN